MLYVRSVAATPSVKVEKTFTFKGSLRTFSNRYHFNGGVPANDTEWHALFDAITAAEKAIYEAGYVTIVSALGYDAGSDMPVSSKTYSLNGTGSFTGYSPAVGEATALVRYGTTARSVKNHPIYLFNYYHCMGWNTSLGADYLNGPQKTAIEAYASSWISGFSDGSHTCVRAGPNGATATGHFTETFLTHRDFPYTRSA